MKKILVVDDEYDLGLLLSQRLRIAGYDPVYCKNGAVAWSRLQEEGADMVITDVQMPEMDGLELCRRMRADPRFRFTPILMLTVRGDESDQVDGYEIGADEYLARPFDFPVLIARLRALERRTLGAVS